MEYQQMIIFTKNDIGQLLIKKKCKMSDVDKFSLF